MSYIFKKENDLNAFEEFVLSHGGGFLQSEKWARVKLEWNSRFYSGFDSDGNRVLTALLMERHIPAAGKIWYCPAGAVTDYGNSELLMKLFYETGKENIPSSIPITLFADTTIETLTVKRANAYTLVLTVLPAAIIFGVGIYVMIRRKHS